MKSMIREEVKNNLIMSLCKEYQTIWLIDLDSHDMELLYSSEIDSVADKVDVKTLGRKYESIAPWYVENFIVDHQKERVLGEVDIDTILSKTSGGDAYYVEYIREVNEHLNYNQVCFDRMTSDDGEVSYLVLGFRDIDSRKQSEIDEVTGLFTRQTFFRKAEELLDRYPEKQFDIVISDIADFKKINDTYGVKTADKILRWVGSFLSLSIKDSLIVGRYGGDQMVMMGEHENISQYISEEGLRLFRQREKENGLPSIITKFGVYENINHNKSIVSNCDKARIALGSIKGLYERHIAYYDDALRLKTEKQQRIENSMYESMENGDFKVFYQPKHDAATGELVGAEALIRWIHPEYGFMSPADFIPLFEQNGFVVENDRYVWKRTCENLRRWEDKGIKTVPISINASKLTIAKEDLISNLQNAVQEYNISPEQLHIEITETMMTEDVEDLVNKLTALRSIGYQIDLDDFGAGYSSINSLSDFPIDIVKLDMSFMKQFRNEKKSKILAATINLAKELGYKTVSEGVELEEQGEVLELLGVDAIQGFLYSKPLSEEDFEKYMLQNQ